MRGCLSTQWATTQPWAWDLWAWWSWRIARCPPGQPWLAQSGAGSDGWSSFPNQYKHTIILQNPTNHKAERILLTPMRTVAWEAGVKQVRSAGVLSLFNINTWFYSKIRPIARQKEFCSHQWEVMTGAQSGAVVRSAGVLSLSNKHAIILQNPTNRKAERILLTPMRT